MEIGIGKDRQQTSGTDLPLDLGKIMKKKNNNNKKR